MTMRRDRSMINPRFSPEINLGHILTAATFVLTIGTGGIGAYVGVRNDIGSLHTEIANIRGDIGARLAGDEQRAADAAHDLDMMRTDQHDLAVQLRGALDNFNGAVNAWRDASHKTDPSDFPR
jgi:hypothetical protein